MEATVNREGATLLRIRLRDWLKLIAVLAGLVIGHAKWQCGRIETVASDLATITQRLSVTETQMTATVREHDQMRAEFSQTTKELRDGIRELNAYLLNR